ncbi:MAG: single-stranded-DNA-specific exonuclease RecJ, partial [Candidatus Omnitrophica bacterium]|nr:single-stranded-DNA-specific exonuclease RecJ [Candidatus Omnitrophota bacterium]
MRKTWNIREHDKILQKELADKLSIPPIVAQLLINRNIDTSEKAQSFLHPSLLKLHDPSLMKGMDCATSRIKKAISKKEKILIYGDYDVDGISATALLSLVLTHMGAKVDHYIPNRIEEGYGLNKKATNTIIKKKIDLLITVDCGITAHSEIDALNSASIDTIITDHHHPSDKLPKAHIIINPLQKGCDYPDKNLSGVGVAFKLASCLIGKDDNWLYEQLDLVCLGTVADVVPLVGENRILVKNGLEELTHTKKIGIKALIETSYLKGKDITSHYVGYVLGPRINASGRLGSPELALRLLLTDNEQEAKDLAKRLEQENRNRQKTEETVLRQALARVERDINFKEERVIVLEDEAWHKGVLGIVASRLVDRFYRPTVMISMDDKEGKGSCRSIKNFHLFEVLGECSDLLKNYGGHSYAAGLTVHKNRLHDFKKRINSIAHERILTDDLIPTVNIDMEIPISSLSKKLLNDLDELSPFGIGNPKPVFSSRNISIKTTPQILRRGGVKMWVTDGKTTAEAIGFNVADSLPSDPLNQRIDLAYSCNLN